MRAHRFRSARQQTIPERMGAFFAPVTKEHLVELHPKRLRNILGPYQGRLFIRTLQTESIPNENRRVGNANLEIQTRFFDAGGFEDGRRIAISLSYPQL